jgi:hypothetical protein
MAFMSWLLILCVALCVRALRPDPLNHTISTDCYSYREVNCWAGSENRGPWARPFKPHNFHSLLLLPFTHREVIF